jgi:aminoglycoside phosphotransferase (APT) family kinase protein
MTRPPSADPAGKPPQSEVTTSTGLALQLERPLLGGRSHATYLAREPATGQRLVIKTGGDLSRLHHEAQALTALAGITGSPAPLLREASRIQLPGCRAQPCLVIDYVPGRHPRRLADHTALGIALATLHGLPPEPFHALGGNTRRLLEPARALASAHAPDLVALLDSLAQAPAGFPGSTTLCHGDASPANSIVCDQGRAVLIDYENAFLTRPGLDLGRALFTIDCQGLPLPQARMDAFLRGYDRTRPLPPSLNLWAAAAALMIGAWRYERCGRPGIPPWPPVLERARNWTACKI